MKHKVKLEISLLLAFATACGNGAVMNAPMEMVDEGPAEDEHGLPVTPETVIPQTPVDPTTQGEVIGRAPTTSSEDPSNTFEHSNLAIDPFDVLSRLSEEGAPSLAARMHSCQKPRYATLRNILTTLGVDMNRNATPPAAGQLFRSSEQVLGAPNYAQRVREAQEWTTAGATRLLDIFVQAAPEIIAAMPNNAHCRLAGQPTQMFDEAGKCTLAGIMCLQGARATQAQKDLCDAVIADASTPEKGRVIAVATILSAAHTCE